MWNMFCLVTASAGQGNCNLLLSSPFQIETLPPELFQCKKLRTLNLGNNCLQTLPSRFGELTGLTQLELRGNRLECLPVELGECRLLKKSSLVVEEDLFNTLPSEVKEQLWRADKEQAWAEPLWTAAEERSLIRGMKKQWNFVKLWRRCSSSGPTGTGKWWLLELSHDCQWNNLIT